MSEYTVTIAGATGKTGRHVVASAAARGWRVRSATRRDGGSGEWARLDWDDETTWRPAFAGSDAAYVLIPFNHPGAPEKTPDLLRNAAEAGVRRIVLLSTLDAEHAASDNPSLVAEGTVQALPVASALLRPTWFLDNFTVGSFAAMTAAGELRLPAGTGRIPFVDARDIAAVAVAALAPDGPEGHLPITGPERIDHYEVASAISGTSGHEVRYTSVSIGEFVELMMARGFPASYGEFLGEALDDVATGRLEIPVHPTVEQLLGRPAYSVHDFARRYAADLATAAADARIRI